MVVTLYICTGFSQKKKKTLTFLTVVYECTHALTRTRTCARAHTHKHTHTIYIRWAGHIARMVEGRSAFKILIGKPTGKRPLGGSRRRWEDSIRMNLEEIDINAGNWIDSKQDRDY